MNHQTRSPAGEGRSAGQSGAPARAASERTDPEWFDPFQDDVPERDVHADLAAAEDAAIPLDPEAAPMATDAATDAPPAPEAEPDRGSAPEAAPAAASVPEADDSPVAARPGRRATRRADAAATGMAGDSVPRSTARGPREVSPAAAAPAPQPLVPASGRSRRGGAGRLPPGQRWKERRLPRVCWDR
ncbi:MAG TPA: hypothetical protein VHL98_02820 [Microvirga sp.]|jgi:hypothetical protein|nr:hypothetical protein [Microvirga sp.]